MPRNKSKSNQSEKNLKKQAVKITVTAFEDEVKSLAMELGYFFQLFLNPQFADVETDDEQFDKIKEINAQAIELACKNLLKELDSMMPQAADLPNKFDFANHFSPYFNNVSLLKSELYEDIRDLQMPISLSNHDAAFDVYKDALSVSMMNIKNRIEALVKKVYLSEKNEDATKKAALEFHRSVMERAALEAHKNLFAAVNNCFHTLPAPSGSSSRPSSRVSFIEVSTAETDLSDVINVDPDLIISAQTKLTNYNTESATRLTAQLQALHQAVSELIQQSADAAVQESESGIKDGPAAQEAQEIQNDADTLANIVSDMVTVITSENENREAKVQSVNDYCQALTGLPSFHQPKWKTALKIATCVGIAAVGFIAGAVIGAVIEGAIFAVISAPNFGILGVAGAIHGAIQGAGLGVALAGSVIGAAGLGSIALATAGFSLFSEKNAVVTPKEKVANIATKIGDVAMKVAKEQPKLKLA